MTKGKSRFGEKNLHAVYSKKPQEEIQQAFAIYLNKRSVREVALKMNWSKQTVKRYREKLGWDAKCLEIQAQVEERSAEKVINRRARNVRILDTALENIQEQLQPTNSESTAANVPIALLDRIVRIQDYLIGKGDGDEDSGVVSPEAKAALELLSKIGDDALKALGDIISNGGADDVPI